MSSDLVQRQQQAYDRYQASVTEGTKQGLHNARALSEQFVNYIENYRQLEPSSVNTSHLGSISFSKQIFYQTLMSQTFHVHWSANSSPGVGGAGNTILVDIRREDANNRYRLRYHGLTVAPRIFYIDDGDGDDQAEYVLSSRSLEIKVGLVSLLFRLTGQDVNDSLIWNHQILVNNRIYANYDLVDFHLT